MLTCFRFSRDWFRVATCFAQGAGWPHAWCTCSEILLCAFCLRRLQLCFQTFCQCGFGLRLHSPHEAVEFGYAEIHVDEGVIDIRQIGLQEELGSIKHALRAATSGNESGLGEALLTMMKGSKHLKHMAVQVLLGIHRIVEKDGISETASILRNLGLHRANLDTPLGPFTIDTRTPNRPKRTPKLIAWTSIQWRRLVRTVWEGPRRRKGRCGDGLTCSDPSYVRSWLAY